MNFLKKVAKKAENALNEVKETLCEEVDCDLVYGAPSSAGNSEVFLHGHLFLAINAARDLPDMESWIAKLYDKKDVTDPFVDVHLSNGRIIKTSVLLNTLDPIWNESYRLELCHKAKDLIFHVCDKDHAYSESIGEVIIPCEVLVTGEIIQGWFPIMAGKGKQQGELNFSVQYVNLSAGPKSYEVDCYFGWRDGNKVQLYQDAHVPESLPQFSTLSIFATEDITYANHQPRSYFKDLRAALQEAQEIICITGWAVWHKIHLLRGAEDDGVSLGDLLIDKANAGVAVYVMVWSEKTSNEFKEQGVMGTHDMETFNFFKNTKVCCALAPREIDVNEFTDVLQNEFASGMYTHHQKCVILDAASRKACDKRRLIAFVGGLDLTGGRWDTPNHPFYETLLNEHMDDFRNSNAKSVPPEEGPREPWHDIHAQLWGPIAYDVFLNFYERWSRQGSRYGRLDPIDVLKIDIFESFEEETGPWRCQIFRSITNDSATFEPRAAQKLNCKKGRLVDNSIAQAYIQMIRNAENFIYIENQYFMGSANFWNSDQQTNCKHLIPVEIAQKIIEKIHTRQRFVAYVVIPMFPEGDPTSAPIQEILYWQYRTMEMMYRKIGQALIETGDTSHPTDWLLFLCPGKRENDGPHLDRLAPASEAFAKTFRESLRFPIYVHSKMMLVDDVYIIIGSANINERSMAGSRDSEIAVGCYQPDFMSQGEVRKFRLSLWAEHLRSSDPTFLYPSSMECVQRMKTMAAYNWSQYLQKLPTPGQLLPYPLNVLQDGKLEYIDGVSTFPDFPAGAKIKGKSNPLIPQKVTT